MTLLGEREGTERIMKWRAARRFDEMRGFNFHESRLAPLNNFHAHPLGTRREWHIIFISREKLAPLLFLPPLLAFFLFLFFCVRYSFYYAALFIPLDLFFIYCHAFLFFFSPYHCTALCCRAPSHIPSCWCAVVYICSFKDI
ncbi:hypothetical protein, unlikely [Trypanosoma congolense IL3000]|uniref:Uncharacterized protein n=1 Tax=Trypanosoma congolense (strain IL3000) TaxID=1068625 RepID=F9WCI1_TRYCI|nr:hypothetical protein, unlikely [Trypanosoma congolense IL3000]